jgi:hypothetical protein
MMFPLMTLSPHEKLFRLFLCTIFISRSSSCSSSSSNNAIIFVAAVSIVINVIIFKYVFDYDRHIFVHLLSCADSVIGSCSC